MFLANFFLLLLSFRKMKTHLVRTKKDDLEIKQTVLVFSRDGNIISIQRIRNKQLK
jgi:hypothetical protein